MFKTVIEANTQQSDTVIHLDNTHSRIFKFKKFTSVYYWKTGCVYLSVCVKERPQKRDSLGDKKRENEGVRVRQR